MFRFLRTAARQITCSACGAVRVSQNEGPRAGGSLQGIGVAEGAQLAAVVVHLWDSSPNLMVFVQ